jgi:hypothetical protein
VLQKAPKRSPIADEKPTRPSPDELNKLHPLARNILLDNYHRDLWRWQERQREAWEREFDRAMANIDAEAAAPAAPIAPEPAPLRRTSNWTTVYNWHAIDAEIARRCFDASGALVIPQQSSLVAGIIAWCADNGRNAPHEGELRKAVKTVCEGLRAQPQPLKKKPSR